MKILFVTNGGSQSPGGPRILIKRYIPRFADRFKNISALALPRPLLRSILHGFTLEKRLPVGLGYMSAILKRQGHEVYLADRFVDPDAWVPNIKSFDFVGIHTSTPYFSDALNILARLDMEGYRGPIAFGGPHMTLEPDSAPPQVDYVIQGESEYLLEDLVTGALPSGTILRTQRITDLDSLPRVDYGLFFDSPRSYDLTIPYTDRRPIFNMTTSRSCSFACSFCMVRDIWGRLWTAHSAERVVDDIGFLVSTYNIGGIYFREDLFTANRQRLVDICRLILSKNLDIHWACETRVDLVSDEETLELMARSGCRGLYIGAESGSQRMLEMYNKEITVDQIQNTCRWARKHGIKVAMSLIVADPRETWEDRLDTWKLVRSARPAFLQLSSYNGIHTGRQTSSFPTYQSRKLHTIEYPNGTWEGQADRKDIPQLHQSPIL